MESCFVENATVVLVHGPWLDAGMWNSVILPLRQHGLQVIAAQLPLTSFEDDLAAIERTLELADGPLYVGGAFVLRSTRCKCSIAFQRSPVISVHLGHYAGWR